MSPTTRQAVSRAEKEKQFTFDYSYNSFVPRDDPEYASQDTVWRDIGVAVLENAYNGARAESRVEGVDAEHGPPTFADAW